MSTGWHSSFHLVPHTPFPFLLAIPAISWRRSRNVLSFFFPLLSIRIFIHLFFPHLRFFLPWFAFYLISYIYVVFLLLFRRAWGKGGKVVLWSAFLLYSCSLTLCFLFSQVLSCSFAPVSSVCHGVKNFKLPYRNTREEFVYPVNWLPSTHRSFSKAWQEEKLQLCLTRLKKKRALYNTGR